MLRSPRDCRSLVAVGVQTLPSVGNEHPAAFGPELAGCGAGEAARDEGIVRSLEELEAALGAVGSPIEGGPIVFEGSDGAPFVLAIDVAAGRPEHEIPVVAVPWPAAYARPHRSLLGRFTRSRRGRRPPRAARRGHARRTGRACARAPGSSSAADSEPDPDAAVTRCPHEGWLCAERFRFRKALRAGGTAAPVGEVVP